MRAINFLTSYFWESLAALMTTLGIYLWNSFRQYKNDQKTKNKEIEEKQRIIQKSILSSLEYRMKEIFITYKEKRMIPFYKLQEFIYMYDDYKALGGNGAYEHMNKKIMNWKIE